MSDKISDEIKWSFGKHQGTRIADIPVDYLVWCWNTFLHERPNMVEHKYIKQEIQHLDKETDKIFTPDPRKI